MRIISGLHKGKRIIAPGNLPVRPTTDMAKEALFNILNNHYYFDEIKVLDLFSGIGSISLELASRGCEDITSVDQHAGCIRFLDKTAENLSLPIQTIKSDVFSFLKNHSSSYDLIFADPPYELDQNSFDLLINTIFEKGLLTDEGLLVVEHSRATDLSHHEHFVRSRKYGGNLFSFFELEVN